MANDGSIASLTEQWIVDTINAIAEFTGRVKLWEGSLGKDGEKVFDELFGRMRTPSAVVLFSSDAAIETEEGRQDYDASYAVFVAVRNLRGGGAARMGEGTAVSEIGVNKVRDLMRTALHDKVPQKQSGGFVTDRSRLAGMQVVFERIDGFVIRVDLIVKECPA